MNTQIQIGDIVKTDRGYGQVYGINGAKVQVLGSGGNLYVAKTATFFKKPAQPFVKN